MEATESMKEAIEIAQKYQLWRKGLIDECPAPPEITKALDCLIIIAIESTKDKT